jgi:16S rRNA (cytosine1407-C5)-methyltransferase
MLERYRELLSGPEWAALQMALEQALPRAIRINPLKTAPEAVRAWAARYNWTLTPVPFCPTGWQVEGGQSVGGTAEHRIGLYYVQDAASMLPAELFDFTAAAAPAVLDMAAAPGGKTTHLLSRMGDVGVLIANDSASSRLPGLRANLRDWGGSCAAVTNLPGERFGGLFPEMFDYVLLDAPCSMENLSHEMRPISAREREGLAARQIRLLESAIRAAKVGGQVVYATCTLSPEENEAVLDAVYTAWPGALRIEAPTVGVGAAGVTRYNGQTYDPAVQNAIRVWPHHFRTSGFFAARITKTAPIPAQRGGPDRGERRRGAAGLPPALPRREVRQVAEALDAYGFDLIGFLDANALTVYRVESLICAAPETLRREFADLHIVEAGLCLAESTPGGLIPSHELVTRFGPALAMPRIRLDSGMDKAWRAGEALRPFDGEGLYLVDDAAGCLIGRGRAVGGKLRALLPERAR